jgi:hypothetical protein
VVQYAEALDQTEVGIEAAELEDVCLDELDVADAEAAGLSCIIAETRAGQIHRRHTRVGIADSGSWAEDRPTAPDLLPTGSDCGAIQNSRHEIRG